MEWMDIQIKCQIPPLIPRAIIPVFLCFLACWVARVQPSWVMGPFGDCHSSVRGQMGSKYKRWCFLGMHEMKWGECLFGLLGRKYIDQHSKNVGTAAFSFARHCWCIHLMLHTRNYEQEREKSLHYWKSWEVAVRGEVVEEKYFWCEWMLVTEKLIASIGLCYVCCYSVNGTWPAW